MKFVTYSQFDINLQFSMFVMKDSAPLRVSLIYSEVKMLSAVFLDPAGQHQPCRFKVVAVIPITAAPPVSAHF